MSGNGTGNTAKRTVRIWVDGCFDMMHFGHANALRQAKEMGDFLVVGVHSDAEIENHKGPTVMKENERYAAVRACKWVDLVVPNAPYFTTLASLDEYDCDFCVHGDDITTLADGTDCYQEVKDAKRYRECKRTQGVSTTDIVGRMLLMTRDHHNRPTTQRSGSIDHFTSGELSSFGSSPSSKPSFTRISHFLPTSRKIVQFSEGREPQEGDRVVYVDGDFDLFHVGHIEMLKKCREFGEYLLVGVHDDPTVNRIKGGNHPLMNLHERVLSVLACRYVDEVVIGAPYSVTQEVLEKVYKVDIVVGGNKDPDETDGDPYAIPKKMGIYRELEPTSWTDFSTDVIVDRIIEQRRLYESRNRKKFAKEVEFNDGKSVAT